MTLLTIYWLHNTHHHHTTQQHQTHIHTENVIQLLNATAKAITSHSVSLFTRIYLHNISFGMAPEKLDNRVYCLNDCCIDYCLLCGVRLNVRLRNT